MKNIPQKITSGIIMMGCLCLLLLISCDKSFQEKGKSTEHHEEDLVEFTEAQYQNAGITLGKLESRNLGGIIKVNGMLDVPPQNLVTISIPYGGVVKQTELLQGMKVSKGQVLVVLEHPDYIQLQQDYLDAKSKLNYIALELNRQEELQKENISATKTYQQIVSEYESLKARVSGLEQKLSIINITPEQLKKNGITKQIKLYAPISGYVTQVNVNIGTYVNPNDMIFKLVDTHHLHAELTVFEKDIERLKTGQKVRFSFNNEDKERTATVYLIGKEIGSDRTVRVHCHLDKEDHELLPGMYLKAYIETSPKETLTIPSKAVMSSGNKNFVFVFKGKMEEEGKFLYTFKKEAIQVGIKNNEYTEVIPSDRIDTSLNIVVTGAYDLFASMGISEEQGHAH